MRASGSPIRDRIPTQGKARDAWFFGTVVTSHIGKELS